MQARALVRGLSARTSAYPYVLEFVERQRLASLGYTSSLRELDPHKAEIFVIISIEIDKERDKISKESARSRRGR